MREACAPQADGAGHTQPCSLDLVTLRSDRVQGAAREPVHGKLVACPDSTEGL